MPQETLSPLARFLRLASRVLVTAALAALALLVFTLPTLLTRLEGLAPAELRLLLEIVKNRFFR